MKQIQISSFSIFGTKVEVLFCTILILQILAKTALIHLLGHFVILLHVFFLNFLLFVLLWKFGNDACHQFVFEQDGEDGEAKGKDPDDKEGYRKGF